MARLSLGHIGKALLGSPEDDRGEVGPIYMAARRIQHGVSTSECNSPFVIERDLVLRHKRSQIEDSLYFLEKRGYLIRHGFQGLTRVAFQLSESALTMLNGGSFPPDEQQAFREALLDVKQASLWGMKLNLGEAWRRLSKRGS